MPLRGSLRHRGEPPPWRESLRRHRGPSAAAPLLVATLQVVARACPAVELQQLEPSCCPSMSSSSFSAVVGNIIILLCGEVAALAGHIGGCQSHTEPLSGTRIEGKRVIICQYPSDPTVALGVVSIFATPFSSLLGVLSVFYPYKGISVPKAALFNYTSLTVFFVVAAVVTALAEGMLIWSTVTEGLHRAYNTHHNMNAECATAKTGLFGGAAFMALNASLFWLVCQMLASNARQDYLCEDEDHVKGDYGKVLATEYDTRGAGQETQV